MITRGKGLFGHSISRVIAAEAGTRMPDYASRIDDIRRRVALLKKEYQSDFQDHGACETDILRASRLYRPEATLIDLGGGISAHNGVLAQLGMTVYVVDILGNYWEHRDSGPASISRELQLLKRCGIRFIQDDISVCDLTKYFPANSIDIITSFHCIEHLHCSPRVVLESAMRVLKPGGTMVIEVPNAVNARKRVAVLCGRTNYGPYNATYYSDVFWGHVREYTVGDLRQLAQNLGASAYCISGRNTIYGDWVQKVPSFIRRCLDRALPLFPGLCSALVLEMVKEV